MPRPPKTFLRSAAAAALLLAALALAAPAGAAVRLSTDPYAHAIGQHASEVEPDTFAWGSTIVAAFQVGRTYDGGAANGGFATSTDAGATWTHTGVLPNITIAGGGPHARLTDTSVAYDPKHGVWLIASGTLDPPGVTGSSLVVSRSTDGGLTWGPPVTVATAGDGADFDKDWIVCDTTSTSPHYGNCYVQWDDFGNGSKLQMSTSTNGGLTWGSAKTPVDAPGGIGGQPLVQPNGTVVVPHASAEELSIGAFRSTNGGASWSASVAVASIAHSTVPGPMRADPLPSAEVDKSGRVYVAWEDCRFRSACSSNDIVMTHSDTGATWSKVVRVPIDPVTSDREHFVPGLAVDPTTSGGGAHIGLAYHYMPTCRAPSFPVRLAFVDSLDGGAHWSQPTELAGPMSPSWLAMTNEGFMTGDYISTSFAAGAPHPVFALAHAPTGGRLDEAIYAASPPMRAAGPQQSPQDCKPPPRKLTSLKIRPSSFHANSKGPSIAKGGHATVSYGSSSPGVTRFTLRRSVRRTGSVCGPPQNGHPRTCSVWVSVKGSFKHNAVKGKNQFHFTGHAGGVKLAPGLYMLIAEPRASGKPAGKTVSVRFTILAPHRHAARAVPAPAATPVRRTAR